MDSLIIPLLIALLAVPLFLQARKQKRAMQEQQKLQKSLITGDRVMTTSGLYGTVVGADDDTIDVEIAPGVTTTWVRAAVREKVNTDTAEAETPSDDEPEPAESAPKAEATDPQSERAESVTESKAQVAEPIEQQKTN
jgi:preprotein translocase subunit YajC